MDHHPEFWNAWPDTLVSELVAHCSSQHLPSSFGRALMKTGFCRLHKLSLMMSLVTGLDFEDYRHRAALETLAKSAAVLRANCPGRLA